ncbi:regulator of cell morphogenesis and NO signaling [Geoalkalibacter ferrihydriticus]|uniref:Iron-sulfur cluster repair protein ScdA n=2 Tax=Geoalkalibacter ferrihydriticus TaxID=392333 RepID=A0A0C2HJQ3_9BACT|nr:iron-sulfur cluster repair di-iron protein [Geoalkalibacter ferrihydriticus]KIH77296.1 iron-sulfur cluster repair protein ScdA [Geoalkalibacter ferrihydriticus DSM 17813]SDM21163.1 regulator of cell morphogenesis and NO signaling [Geoalkalibacter ferrihydriticus]
MSQEKNGNMTIGALVAEDYRIADVFEKHGIDFCCGGQATLAATCQENDLDLTKILQEMETVKKEPIGRSENFATWSLPFLIDYIVNTHHAYLKENDAHIVAYARKIAEVHRVHHPEVIEIATIFAKIADDMAVHLKAEEEVFFPAVKRVDTAVSSGQDPQSDDRALIKSELTKLHREHEQIGDAIHKIRHLAADYAIPEDACNTFVITYKKLKEFEDDLHKHVHLENNILFLKAAQL